MKVFKFLNPQGAIGQVLILGFFLSAGSVGTFMWVQKNTEPCPPTTAINVDQKVKAKRNSSVESAIPISGGCDCEEWLNSLSNKEKRRLLKK